MGLTSDLAKQGRKSTLKVRSGVSITPGLLQHLRRYSQDLSCSLHMLAANVEWLCLRAQLQDSLRLQELRGVVFGSLRGHWREQDSHRTAVRGELGLGG